MKKRLRPALVILSILSILSLLLLSCVSPAKISASQMIDCGSERLPGLENQEGRDCFYAAYQECRPAKYQVGYQTREGMDQHQLAVVGREQGVCKVKHTAEIKYVDRTYESVCSLVKEETKGKARFRLVDCQGEEATGTV